MTDTTLNAENADDSTLDIEDSSLDADLDTGFSKFGLAPSLLQSLENQKITTPTPIQDESIPLGIAGHDILASAQTGTGKTLAFLIPILTRIESHPGNVLILSPTRELALQSYKTLNALLGRSSGSKAILLIGGEPMPKQLAQLRQNPRFVVGTPGRINDHLQRGKLKLEDTRYLVLDEADRMLDMGFDIQLERIANYLPEEIQSFMFSATVSSNIEKLAQKYLTNPKRISIGDPTAVTTNIKQEIIHTSAGEKYSHLVNALETREGSIIVFVKTKHGAKNLSEKLKKLGHSSDAIHGDLPQRKRERVLLDFRNNKNRIMVATDVAARGLDIPHIQHVINYDLPQSPEDYIHRIGRTARAGKEGHALCLVSSEESGRWKMIHRFLNPGEKSSFRRDNDSGGRQRDFSGRRSGRPSGRSGEGRFDRSRGRSSDSFKEGRPRRFSDSASEERPERSFARSSQRSFEGPSERRFKSSEDRFDQPRGREANRSQEERSGSFSDRSPEKRFERSADRPERRFGRSGEGRFERSSSRPSGERTGRFSDRSSERRFERSSSRPSEGGRSGRFSGRSSEGRSERPSARPERRFERSAEGRIEFSSTRFSGNSQDSGERRSERSSGRSSRSSEGRRSAEGRGSARSGTGRFEKSSTRTSEGSSRRFSGPPSEGRSGRSGARFSEKRFERPSTRPGAGRSEGRPKVPGKSHSKTRKKKDEVEA